MTEEKKSMVPKLRFPEFTATWEQRKLNEIASIYDGTHQTPRYTSNGIPFLSVENITTLQSSKFISEKDFLRDFPVYPKKGDVLLTRIGDVGTANVYERNQKVAFYVSLALLKLRETDPYFVNASFRSNSTRKEVWKRTLHIAFPKKINKNEIGKVNIQIPSLAEQRKIGIFFYSLDRLITLHQRKLEGLSKLKKSLLQKMFPKNGSLGPELRFPGFTGDWEQRELKDVAEIVGGGTPSTSVPAYWNGSIDWYSPTEIGQENFAKGSKRKISNEGLNNSSAKLLPAHKTILFTSRATIGEAAILEREGATNQGFQSIVTKEGVDVYFLYSYKHHLKKQALIKASGSTFLEISKNEVEGLHVPVPSGEEQAKIGSFFKLVDKAITLHQRKLESLKKLKKSLLQQMFV